MALVRPTPSSSNPVALMASSYAIAKSVLTGQLCLPDSDCAVFFVALGVASVYHTMGEGLHAARKVRTVTEESHFLGSQ